MAEATFGDENDVPCPSCGEELQLGDWRIDGCLEAGQAGECGSCGAAFRLAAVDWEATVYVEPMPAIETKEGGDGVG